MQSVILIIFLIGYLFIIFEQRIRIDKAATALLTGGLCWVAFMFSGAGTGQVNHLLYEQVSEISGILFFLLGAMTIVELIDAHDGFDIITRLISTTSKRKLLWIICFISFFFSAVLDNLTTAIVMVSQTRYILDYRNDPRFFAGMIVVSAKAWGAWSPTLRLTTTML